MMKQNQVIAIVKGRKTKTKNGVTSIYHTLQKKDLFAGVDRKYRPIADEGIDKPAEKKHVQAKVQDCLSNLVKTYSNTMDMVATLDKGNCIAAADIKVGENVIVKNVPATHLIYLEKQLNDILTIVKAIPVLDPSESWAWNETTACYSSEPRDTSSTTKVLKPIILYEATKEHPAQVEKFTTDEIVGNWTTISLSGAIKMSVKEELVEKVLELQDAVKIARANANNIEVEVQKTGTALMKYLFS